MKRYALAIGIDQYADAQILPLRYAVGDASELCSLLAMGGDCRIPSENQVLLYNTTATREGIIQNLERIANLCLEDDMFLFFYAGHGYSEHSGEVEDSDKLRKYLIPFDTKVNKLASTALDFNSLAEHLKRFRCKRLLAFFDCCYSGAVGGRTLYRFGTRTSTPVPVGTDYLRKLSGLGWMVMTACTGQEVAQERDELRHGIFTYSILEGLRGHADLMKDGYVDHGELFLYSKERTMRLSDNKQNPVFDGWTEGPSIFLSQPVTVPLSPSEKNELENRICDRFSSYRLQEVRIAKSDDITDVGKEAALYLQERLRNNCRIAVTCGRTLIEAIKQMERSTLTNVEIFPLNGSPSDEVHITDSMVLTYLLWSNFEPGKAVARVIPTGVPKGLFEKVMEEIGGLAKKMLVEAKDADIFLFGIGSPNITNKNIQYILKKAGITLEELQKLGAIGEINFNLYRRDGKFLALCDDLAPEDKEKIRAYNLHFLALKAEDFEEVAKKRGVDMIAVAAGADKREAIAAGIRGGFIRTLITDIHTAQWLAHSAEAEQLL